MCFYCKYDEFFFLRKAIFATNCSKGISHYWGEDFKKRYIGTLEDAPNLNGLVSSSNTSDFSVITFFFFNRLLISLSLMVVTTVTPISRWRGTVRWFTIVLVLLSMGKCACVSSPHNGHSCFQISLEGEIQAWNPAFFFAVASYNYCLINWLDSRAFPF